MRTFYSRYTYTRRWGNPRYEWVVESGEGAVQLHITDYGEEHEAKYGNRYSAGLEVHYRSAPGYMQHQPPSHTRCHCIQAPCWHDGTTMYAEEHWLPIWLSMQPTDSPDRMLELLEGEYAERFSPQEDD